MWLSPSRCLQEWNSNLSRLTFFLFNELSHCQQNLVNSHLCDLIRMPMPYTSSFVLSGKTCFWGFLAVCPEAFRIGEPFEESFHFNSHLLNSAKVGELRWRYMLNLSTWLSWRKGCAKLFSYFELQVFEPLDVQTQAEVILSLSSALFSLSAAWPKNFDDSFVVPVATWVWLWSRLMPKMMMFSGVSSDWASESEFESLTTLFRNTAFWSTSKMQSDLQINEPWELAVGLCYGDVTYLSPTYSDLVMVFVAGMRLTGNKSVVYRNSIRVVSKMHPREGVPWRPLSF